MNPLEKFERAIGKVFRPGPDQRREPIEIRREVLREIADQVQPAGGGEYLFPFTGIKVELFASDATSARRRSKPSSACPVSRTTCNAGDRGSRLQGSGVGCAGGGEGDVAGEEAPPVPYRITYQRSAAPPPRPRCRDPRRAWSCCKDQPR